MLETKLSIILSSSELNVTWRMHRHPRPQGSALCPGSRAAILPQTAARSVPQGEERHLAEPANGKKLVSILLTKLENQD